MLMWCPTTAETDIPGKPVPCPGTFVTVVRFSKAVRVGNEELEWKEFIVLNARWHLLGVHESEEQWLFKRKHRFQNACNTSRAPPCRLRSNFGHTSLRQSYWDSAHQAVFESTRAYCLGNLTARASHLVLFLWHHFLVKASFTADLNLVHAWSVWPESWSSVIPYPSG